MSAQFTPEQDRQIFVLRRDGLRWYEVADRIGVNMAVCIDRYKELVAAGEPAVAPQPAAPPRKSAVSANGAEVRSAPIPQDPDVVAASAAREGCRALLRAQLRCGQFFGRQRAEWLARHGVAA